MHVLNEGLAFLLEIAAIAALAWWGFTTGGNTLVAAVLGIGAPVVAVIFWGLFAAPRARFTVALPLVLLVKAAVFGAGALALYGVGHHGAAIGFAVIALLNTALATVDREAHFRAAG
ncbi:YrdB family protein [Actinomadura madurae]|uniref:YrdB family protein n=1 Tax=Actinomadura madurae TaxID=1993 RepID=UPI0020D21F39|nr:YrdB family protein [Actinomadura madurae]MCP9952248.1 YrdB family protein [Actinomadura madurae]MCP9969013.1 YrdB family protein [Actinomadura madurae]MCP9981481.1 YrdB family protein [Actinomadura madurae]MCQ0007004.1 YrdB family protein [Actinomadura madurae]MCQ0017685.1 YrdB family protein [Actinomadura madurae]